MKLVLVMLLFCSNTYIFSQKSNVSFLPTPELTDWQIKHYSGNRGNVNCATDTVGYVQAKTTNTKTKILYSNNTYASRAGQLFVATSSVPITVHGFRWYGYSFDPDGLTNPIISVECSIYAASSDSLPQGSPLATQTILVDDNPMNAQRDVVFTTPIVMTGNYIITLNNTVSDFLFIASNDEDNNDGILEGLSCSFYEPGGIWQKNINLWAYGDFDFIFEPFVSYTIDADFVNPGTGCVGSPVTFTNSSKGPLNFKYYNTDKFFNQQLSYHWDYGNSTQNIITNGVGNYSPAGSYVVTLTDTLFGWTGFCTDQKTHTVDIFSVPSPPSSFSPVPVCEYSPANDLTATGSGDFTWYSSQGLNTVIGSGSPFNSGINSTDTVYVTQTVNGCESIGQQVPVSFAPNPIPTFMVSLGTNMTAQFSGAPTAMAYNWDFGDSTGTSVMNNPTYTYNNPGSYNACLTVDYSNGCSNSYCEIVTFVGVNDPESSGVIIYPNPFEGGIVVEQISPDKTLDYMLYDVTGKVIFKGELSTVNTRINLTHLPSGSYLFVLHKNNNVLTKHLIKQ